VIVSAPEGRPHVLTGHDESRDLVADTSPSAPEGEAATVRKRVSR